MTSKYKQNDRIVVALSDDKYFMQHGYVIKTGNKEVMVKLDSGITTWFADTWVDYEVKNVNLS